MRLLFGILSALALGVVLTAVGLSPAQAAATSQVLTIDRVNKVVTVRNRANGEEHGESYDKLVLCQGANPIRPPLPGIDHPRLFTLRNIPDMDAIKAVVDQGATSAVIVGGGYIGMEVAEALRHRGLTVELVKMLPQIMPPLNCQSAVLRLRMRPAAKTPSMRRSRTSPVSMSTPTSAKDAP